TNIRVNVLPLVAGTNIEWEVVDVSNVIGATSGSGPIADPIVQQLTNTSTVIGTVTYRVKTELNGCYGGSTDYIVEVHPLPKVNLPERSVICIGENGEAFTSVLLDTGLSE
ncbi:PKD-like domain-containing protein, partial [Flavobacterium enshiense]|uniref:PKD-like domain-containing protein n=1 Tax=Flavobacterium enshiense TaxID=1341165 RepID=UPI00345DD5B3